MGFGVRQSWPTHFGPAFLYNRLVQINKVSGELTVLSHQQNEGRDFSRKLVRCINWLLGLIRQPCQVFSLCGALLTPSMPTGPDGIRTLK